MICPRRPFLARGKLPPSTSCVPLLPSPVVFPAEENEYQPAQKEEGHSPGQLNHVRNNDAVFPGAGVVLATEQQNLVDRRTDFPRRGIDQPEPQIERPERDPVEVARELALGCQNHDSAGVRELLGNRIVRVAKADGSGESLDLRLLSGQEVPALGPTRAPVHSGVHLVFRRGEHSAFGRIDTHRQDGIVLAQIERDPFQAFVEIVENPCAQHGTVVIGKREDHRLLAEILAQFNRFSGFVLERQVQWDRSVQFLIDSHVLEQCGPHADILNGNRATQLLGRCAKRNKEAHSQKRGRKRKQRNTQGFAAPTVPKPTPRFSFDFQLPYLPLQKISFRAPLTSCNPQADVRPRTCTAPPLLPGEEHRRSPPERLPACRTGSSRFRDAPGNLVSEPGPSPDRWECGPRRSAGRPIRSCLERSTAARNRRSNRRVGTPAGAAKAATGAHSQTAPRAAPTAIWPTGTPTSISSPGK